MMKLILLLSIALLIAVVLTGCTLIPTQHGTAQFWGDYQNLNFVDGGVSLSCSVMTHSGVVKAHWHGIVAVGAEGAGAFSGAGPVVKGGAVLGTAIANRPTSRTPAPAVLGAH